MVAIASGSGPVPVPDLRSVKSPGVSRVRGHSWFPPPAHYFLHHDVRVTEDVATPHCETCPLTGGPGSCHGSVGSGWKASRRTAAVGAGSEGLVLRAGAAADVASVTG